MAEKGHGRKPQHQYGGRFQKILSPLRMVL